MWEDALPEDDDGLRQGDLLSDVPFPQLITTLQPVGGQLQVTTESRPALVVSQCCTSERGVLALAVVRGVNVPAGSMATFWNIGPARSLENPEAGKYDFNKFGLRRHPQLPLLEPEQEYVADMTSILTLRGEQTPLRELRLARMSPEGRRALRYNLAMYWARVEAEDAQKLSAVGLTMHVSN